MHVCFSSLHADARITTCQLSTSNTPPNSPPQQLPGVMNLMEATNNDEMGRPATHDLAGPCLEEANAISLVSIACRAPTPAAVSVLASMPASRTDSQARAASPPLDFTRTQTGIIMFSLSSAVFIAALDMTIITTSLPAISSSFGPSASASAYTWIGASFNLAHSASTPLLGRLSDIWGRKPVLQTAVAVFFIGSLMCAVGNGIGVFLAGRAVQGLGAAGVLTMVNVCVGDLFSLRDRGLYFGLLSIVWAFASGVGPVLGGVFAQKLTWRWCFYLNLPIIGVVFVLLWFLLHLENPKTPLWQGLKAVDWAGALLIIGGTLMLLLGLNFGGVSEPWNSPTVISLIVVGASIGGMFLFNEWKLAKIPVIPLRIFASVSSAAAFAVCFCHAYVFLGIAYYLPLYFQAVLGAGPMLSGVYLLPFIVSLTVFSAATGIYIQKTGNYLSSLYIGLTLLTLGTGLFINLGFEADWPRIVLFQIVAGIGVGLCFEGTLLAVQAKVAPDDMAVATATMSFIRTLSTAISIVVGGVTFQNQMVKELAEIVDELGPEYADLLSNGFGSASVEAIDSLPPDVQFLVRQALYHALRTAWIMYVAIAGAALFASLFIRAHHLSRDRHVVTLGVGRRDNE